MIITKNIFCIDDTVYKNPTSKKVNINDTVKITGYKHGKYIHIVELDIV